MKFADFEEGMVAEVGPTQVSEQDILEFAKRYDPQWFHTDVAASAKGPYGGLIASGWQTCGLAMRLSVDHFLKDSESFGSPGLAYLKWLAPVKPNDALILKATVLEKRVSSKNPKLGVLRWRWQMRNQHNIEVLDLEVTSLFDLSQSPASA
ncbi:MAG: MaoC family dehydratase [Betaproteobacteria bacterium]